MTRSDRPILIALVDDYDVVLTGVASMLDGYRDRVLVAEIDANATLHDTVDIALYDSFAQPESDHDEIEVLIRSPQARRVVVYTWNFHPDLVQSAPPGRRARLPVQDAVRRRAGQRARGRPRRRDRHQRPARPRPQHPRPGLARADRGHHRPGGRDPGPHHPGQEQCRRRPADLPQPQHRQVLHPCRLPQIGVASRTQAVLWGIQHGFAPDHHRIDHWRGGP